MVLGRSVLHLLTHDEPVVWGKAGWPVLETVDSMRWAVSWGLSSCNEHISSHLSKHDTFLSRLFPYHDEKIEHHWENPLFAWGPS